MEKIRRPEYYDEDVIPLGEYLALLRAHWKKVAGATLLAGVFAVGCTFALPNFYRSAATITPAVDAEKQNPALGAIASLGFQVGPASKLEDLEALFKSGDLTVRVFRKHNLWTAVFPDRFDPKTGAMRVGWAERLAGKTPSPPGDWDAIRAAKDLLKVSANRRMGTLEVSFESRSPETSAAVVRAYLEEARNRLQEEAFDRASKNKKFIQEQIARTVDPLTRDRLYALYGQEVEREMLARNREQFGFRIIDAPRVPDRKSRPKRRLVAMVAALLAGFVSVGWVFVRYGPKRVVPQVPAPAPTSGGSEAA